MSMAQILISAESRGFSPGAPVSPTGQVDLVG
jgi:hypothetical protein